MRCLGRPLVRDRSNTNRFLPAICWGLVGDWSVNMGAGEDGGEGGVGSLLLRQG